MYNFLQFFDEMLINLVSADSSGQIFSVAASFPQSATCVSHYSRSKHFAVLTGLARSGVGKLRSAASFFPICRSCNKLLNQYSILQCTCLRRTLCARFSGDRRTVTSSHPQLISCITWHWKKLLDEQWSRNLDYERWYLYRCSLYAPCGIFADYEFRSVLQLSQTVAQYNSTTAFCNLWWHSSTVIFVGNNNKIH